MYVMWQSSPGQSSHKSEQSRTYACNNTKYIPHIRAESSHKVEKIYIYKMSNVTFRKMILLQCVALLLYVGMYQVPLGPRYIYFDDSILNFNIPLEHHHPFSRSLKIREHISFYCHPIFIKLHTYQCWEFQLENRTYSSD